MNLLLTGAFNYSESQRLALTHQGWKVWYLQQESETLPLAPNEVDAVVCNGLFLYHDINGFSRLKFIQLTSAGLDRAPVEIIRRRGITLHNARGVYSVPMAEWAVCKVLDNYKHTRHFHNNQKERQWAKNRSLRELSDKHLAVIGAGNVGQEVAKRFTAFGVIITGFDVHTQAVDYFDEMDLTEHLSCRIGEFDLIVITAPLLPSTRHLFNRDILERLRSDAILVNISRGALIDEQALVDVAAARPDVHFSLDVFEEEPLNSDSPLWNYENIEVSPHNSFVSDGNNERMFNVIYDNLKEIID